MHLLNFETLPGIKKAKNHITTEYFCNTLLTTKIVCIYMHGLEENGEGKCVNIAIYLWKLSPTGEENLIYALLTSLLQKHHHFGRIIPMSTVAC